jgi:monoamine oxidase
VIIIGGGISGLSAFDQLIKNGVKDVILIEASDRFGGRMYTANVCEYP